MTMCVSVCCVCVCVCVCVCSDQLLVKELFNWALMVFGCERVKKRRTEVEVEEEMMRRGEEEWKRERWRDEK